MESTINYDSVLQTYSLIEIFEWNDVTEEEALAFMIEKSFLKLPTPKPVDLLDDKT